jgi:hypothetical protein
MYFHPARFPAPERPRAVRAGKQADYRTERIDTMNWRLLLTVWVCLALLPSLAAAKLYKFRDRSGALRYTDNLAEVPPDQRPNVETEPEIVTPETAPAESPEAKPKAGGKKSASPGQPQPAPAPPASWDKAAGEARLEADNLLETRRQLEEEFAGLMQEKQALGEERKKIEDEKMAPLIRKKAVDAMNQKVRDLNKRIADFETRRNAFEAQADAFNAKWKSQE